MNNQLLKQSMSPSLENNQILSSENFEAYCSESKFMPVSAAQERLWFLEQMNPGGTTYNFPATYLFKGRLNYVVLEKSLCEIIQRHEILRAIFPSVNGQPIQRIIPFRDFALPVEDLRHLPETKRKAEALRLVNYWSQQPFDIAENFLWRFNLVSLAEEEHIFLLTIHHLIFDLWSLNVFMEELTILYEAFSCGNPSPLPELPLQYSDFTIWQQQTLQGERFQYQLSYWKQQMRETPSPLKLPIQPSSSRSLNYQGKRQFVLIAKDLTESLKTLSQQENVTLYMTLLTAFKILLYIYTEQNDIIVCTPMAGRHRAQTKQLIGYINNILPLRTDLSGNLSFRDLLGRVRQVALGAYKNLDIPFQTITEFPNLAHTPLTRVMFALQPSPCQNLTLSELTITYLNFHYIHNGTANFDLSLFAEATEDTLAIGLDYKIDLFDETTIAEILANFQELLKCVAVKPESCLSSFQALIKTRQKQLSNEVIETTETNKAYQEPRNELELQLTRIFEKVLNIKQIGIQDDFFNLGGHSLSALRLMSEIQETLHKQLPLTTLLKASTVECLASLISQDGWTTPWSSLVPIQTNGSKSPLFLIAPGASTAIQFLDLARFLGKDQPVYCLQAQDVEKGQVSYSNIEDLASFYIQQIQTIQREGPYILGGRCASGNVIAFEMAQQLQALGQKVKPILMIDPWKDAFKSFFPAPPKTQKSYRYYLKRLKHYLKRGELLSLLLRKTRLQMIIKKFTESSKTNHNLRIQTVANNHKLALHNYQPKVFSGKIILFVSEERLKFLHIYKSWQDLCTEKLEIHIISAGHGNMLNAPDISHLGAELKPYLESLTNQ